MDSKVARLMIASLLVFSVILMGLSVVIAVSAQMQMGGGDNSQQCETCSMKAGSDSQAHFKVTDGEGKTHYVDCFMCALKLLPKYDQVHIVTYCDYYGPKYTITIDFSQHGGR